MEYLESLIMAYLGLYVIYRLLATARESMQSKYKVIRFLGFVLRIGTFIWSVFISCIEVTWSNTLVTFAPKFVPMYMLQQALLMGIMHICYQKKEKDKGRL